MKKMSVLLLFVLLNTTNSFSFSKKENSIEQVSKSIIELNRKPITKTCVTVGVSISFVSVEIEVCCWRTKNTGSPVYECSYGAGKTALIKNTNGVGYVDIEKLDKRVLEEIASNKLTAIRIEKSKTVDLGDYKVAIKDGDYKILKDESGRYLKVDLLLSK